MDTSFSYQGSRWLTSVLGPLFGKWTRPYLRHRLPLTLQETFMEFLCLGSFWQKSIDTRPSLQPTFDHATLGQNFYRNIFAKCCVTDWPGVRVTKAQFVNFSVSKIFDLSKVHLKLFESHLYLTGATAAELRRHLPNINVIFNSKRVFWQCWKFRKITERRKLA